jgi:microcystin-dependent protein
MQIRAALGLAVVFALSSLIGAQQTSNQGSAPAIAGMPTSPPTALGDGTYVGEIRMFASEGAPKGWRECDGTELNISTHQALSSVLGARFGSTQAGMFRIPDLRGMFVRSWNHNKAFSVPGSNDQDAAKRTIPPGAPAYPDGKDHVGTTQADQLQTHKHVEPGHHHDVTGYGFDYLVKGGPNGGLSNKNPPVPTGDVAVNLGGPVDMSGGTAVRNGIETYPSNVYLIFCIRDPNSTVTP